MHVNNVDSFYIENDICLLFKVFVYVSQLSYSVIHINSIHILSVFLCICFMAIKGYFFILFSAWLLLVIKKVIGDFFYIDIVINLILNFLRDFL